MSFRLSNFKLTFLRRTYVIGTFIGECNELQCDNLYFVLWAIHSFWNRLNFDFSGNKLNADVGELLVHIIDILWAFFFQLSLAFLFLLFKVGVRGRASVEEEGNIALPFQSDQKSFLRILLSLKLILSKTKRFPFYGVRTCIFSWTRELSAFLVVSSSMLGWCSPTPSLIISLRSINAFEHKYHNKN